jgi:uncharacterized protein with PQ loop repeat|tara:strand:+ start:340 stop:636 length:297 start_codon:yes stop_codon:yes gene_type:complete
MDEVTIIEILMSIVGLMMALSCAPQILRILETKSSNDVSIMTTQILVFGEVCWIGYAIHIESIAVFVYGFLSLVLLSIQLGIILAFREPKVKDEEQEV